MQEILALFLIAIGLSMDAFSLALGYGTKNLKNKYNLQISLSVGIFHFFMPLLGLLIGRKVLYYLKINPHFLMGIILLFIVLQMIIELLKRECKEYKLTTIDILLFSLSVSLDSFSIGLGLNAITNTNNYILASTIFCFTSFSITYLGLILGKYTTKYLGNYARIAGIILLTIIAFVNLCQL